MNQKNGENIKKTRSEVDFDTRLKESFEKGPLNLLVRCFIDKSIITVHVRRERDCFAKCTGVICAFDKHMNLILNNVKEVYDEIEVTYKKQKLIDPINHPGRNRKRAVKVHVQKTRMFVQLFIKGSSIILINRNN
ncbi:small nuclear ribonucleoprotein D2 [Acrasis kona]|uniref:Small nuclear ribonucleoprotein D2 n=1 Tax=Acrasis kona TaxID=1008807 RepID=A0AAW2ZGE5_9EUKA